MVGQDRTLAITNYEPPPFFYSLAPEVIYFLSFAELAAQLSGVLALFIFRVRSYPCVKQSIPGCISFLPTRSGMNQQTG